MTPEGYILDAVLDYLAAEHITAFRCNTGAVKIDERFVRFGTPGFSDILAVVTVSGKFKGFPVQWVEPFFLECKSEKGRQSAEQLSFERMVKDAGAQYFIIRSIENLRDVLHQHGVKTSDG